MPRIRSIKPEFFLDEDLARLAPMDRLVFIGLWCQADREGRIEDRPGRLKVQVAPYDEVDMKAVLDRLVAAGFLVRYTVEGRAYIQVRTFLRHQRPHKTEQPSVLPPLDNGTRTVVTPLSNGSSTVGERSGMEEGMEEGKGKEEKSQTCPQERTAASKKLDLPPFALLWNEKVAGSPLKTIRVWTAKRDRVVKARLAEEGDLGLWGLAMEHLAASPHHRGENDRGWVADVDFLLQAEQYAKWLDLAHGGPPVKADPGVTPQLRRLMGGV
jgi:hypothetical protein